MWVHSHVGIAPNELADLLADDAAAGAHDEPAHPTGTGMLAYFGGVKRGVSRAVFFCTQLKVQEQLLGYVQHTLLPTDTTWDTFADSENSRILREDTRDTLAELRSDRAGLHGERPHMVWPKGTWARRRSELPCGCGCKHQTRWHFLTECPGPDGRVQELRAAAARKLKALAATLDATDLEVAWEALASRGELQGHVQRVALRVLCGLPSGPAQGAPRGSFDRRAARALASVYDLVRDMLQLVREWNQEAIDGDSGKAWRVRRGAELQGAKPPPVRVWRDAHGEMEEWQVGRTAAQAITAWRLLLVKKGPRDVRRERIECAQCDPGAADGAREAAPAQLDSCG